MTVTLPYSGALDWEAMAGWLGARAISGVECITDDRRYVRSIRVNGIVGTIAVQQSGAPGALIATIALADPSAIPGIVERIRRIFDLDAELEHVHAHLSSDERLAALIAQRPGLRVPGAWDGYELAVRAVLGQQISVDAASKLAGRLVEKFGTPLAPELQPPGTSVRMVFPAPEVLAEADIGSLGMPGARAAAIRNVARVAATDPSMFAPARDLNAPPDTLAGTVARLCALPGIGPWTAHYIAMRGLGERDAFPVADIGLMRALANADGVRPTPRELARISEAWAPWRSYAALHLWAGDGARSAMKTA